MLKDSPQETLEHSDSSAPENLVIENLTTCYGEVEALKKISLNVPSDKLIALLGSNGAGKTTLLKTLTGLIKPVSGQIYFQEELLPKNPSLIIKKGISSVPEGRELFGAMSVYDNLILGSYPLTKIHRRRVISERFSMVFDLFPILKERLNQRADTLSGGQQQMLALGRAIMADPRLLALDEPSLGLSPLLVSEMMKHLEQIKSKLSLSVLLVEQNARAALKVADYVYVLERGSINLEGSPEEVMSDPAFKSAYIGI